MNKVFISICISMRMLINIRAIFGKYTNDEASNQIETDVDS